MRHGDDNDTDDDELDDDGCTTSVEQCANLNIRRSAIGPS